jgi:adenosylcobinamide-GDP ribazoletransferase
MSRPAHDPRSRAPAQPSGMPESEAGAPRSARSPLAGLLLALQFLTVIPVPRPRRGAGSARAAPTPDMVLALPWFPAVGLLVGGLLALADRILAPVTGLALRSALLLAVTAGLTGMLHFDGFIDCCDALLGTRPSERRLEILRDSRVGAYGVVGGGLLLLIRFAALAALARPDLRLLALLIAPLLGRWSMVYAIARFPYARPAGLGSAFRAHGRHLALATLGACVALAVLGVAVAVSVAPAHPWSLVPLVACVALAALLVTLVVTHWISRRLDGGLTGDAYGALNECVEVATLVLLPAVARLVLRVV